MGALMLSINSNHPDVEEFIDVKSDLNKVTKANISIKVTKEFMEAVRDDLEYELSFTRTETNETISKVVKAKELFRKLAYMNWDYAEPGILFWDNIKSWSLLSNNPEFEYAGVNPCAEEPLPAGGSCLLGSINLAEFVEDAFTDKAKFKIEEFRDTVFKATVALNEVLDEGLSLHPLLEQRDSVGDWRQIGTGIFGLSDCLIKLGIRYGSPESLALCSNIAEFMLNESLYASSLLAKELDVYPKYNNLVLQSDFMQANLMDYAKETIMEYGLRNSQLLTIAPTGTLSSMLGVSGGIEPIFANYYNRRTESLHGKDKIYKIYTPIVKEYMDKNGITDDAELPDYFVTSGQLDYKERIDMQAVFQQYIDASISSTINLPKEATIEQVEEIYMYAHEKKLKGITVFRDQCKRLGILTTTEQVEEIIKTNIAPKRPKELQGELSLVKAKGKQYVVIVGLLEGKPYEVFAFEAKHSMYVAESGTIIKVKKGQYRFVSEHQDLPDIGSLCEGDLETSCTLYTSMLLRHGIDIEFIIKTARKIDDNITSFVVAMNRILSKYIVKKESGELCPECGGKIIYDGGCSKCIECGYSRCG